MKYDSDTFCRQYPQALNFVQHLAYYRASRAVFDKLDIRSSFWVTTVDAHIKLAAIQWCKVFGSHGCNATHWKQVPTTDVDELRNLFRARLFDATGLSQETWEQYHKSMCDFRNKFIAHCDLSYRAPVPDFDVALKVVYAYDDWIRDLISPDYHEGQTLRETFEHLRTTSESVAEEAMRATRGMGE